MPVVLSTVNVKTGANEPTIHQLAGVLDGIEAIDRTTINAWEDATFVSAVKATGRKKLLMTALWTEACLTFPTLDALREGYEVYPVVDAVGGTSLEAHRAALERVVQAGAQTTSWVQVLCELQRDWARAETAKQFAEILFDVEGHLALPEAVAAAAWLAGADAAITAVDPLHKQAAIVLRCLLPGVVTRVESVDLAMRQ